MVCARMAPSSPSAMTDGKIANIAGPGSTAPTHRGNRAPRKFATLENDAARMASLRTCRPRLVVANLPSAARLSWRSASSNSPRSLAYSAVKKTNTPHTAEPNAMRKDKAAVGLAPEIKCPAARVNALRIPSVSPTTTANERGPAA